MAKAAKRIPLEHNTDIGAILEAMRTDKEPRVIEQAGEALAVLAPVEDFIGADDVPKSRRFRDRLLALAGSWSDVDADELIKEIYQRRHHSLPSRRVEW